MSDVQENHFNMALEDRVATLEIRVQELGAHYIVALAEIEALMFCLIAALRVTPLDPTVTQLKQQMEQLRAMTLASATSDEIEEIRSRKAQQIFDFVAAAIRQRRQPVGDDSSASSDPEALIRHVADSEAADRGCDCKREGERTELPRGHDAVGK
jgi:hypothetical protein